MNSLIKKTEKLALEEINKYGSPPLELFKISSKQALLLAKKYHCDQTVCLVGSMLADFKLGEAFKKDRLKDHITMSSKAARKFLKKEKIDNDTISKIVHCVDAHHGSIAYETKEAELVANADCYRFLTPRGVIAFIDSLARSERMKLDQIIEYVEQKADEKWSIVSLPEVKKELGPNYKLIKKLVQSAKKNV